ncbi:M24 family metallopeptidase [Bhargavaea cecembensis]|uniref:M24 family metallopeptidase n=1 Tax=Bhargavaea cecembensis TaxID=394098 RepID=UPI00058C661B|nr:Xaa-Pro peptidase family protein [Bhargavaea cecembensis]
MSHYDTIRTEMERLGLDGFMITGEWNRRYVSGFTGSNGAVLITRDHAEFITDYRYFEQAGQQTGLEVVLHAEHTGHKQKIYDEVTREVEKHGLRRVGFEQQHVSFGNYERLKGQTDAELVPTYDLIENIRMIKTPEEIEKLRIASRITDDAYEHILGFIRPGQKETDVADELVRFIKEQGGHSVGFYPIVASGIRSSMPHGRASDKMIGQGEMITIDFGANFEGYWSDISRTVSVGEPSSEMLEIQDVVLRSFLNCRSQIKPGMTDSEVDEKMREVLIESGFNERSGTGTGHGIGLEVHEKPLFSVDSEKVLQPNMVITIEPGIYLPGVGGARVEDVLLITEDGCEVLTPSTKELVVLDVAGALK